MKTKLTFTLIMIIGLLLTSCKSKIDLVNDEFPEEKQEVIDTFVEIANSIKEGDIDKLIAFHAYGPKFTEFNYDPNGIGYSFNSKENEANERAFFGGNKVTRFAAKANTVNIAVYYGNVANVTFISDFEVAGIGTINNLITLLFVKTKGEWKLVHEHHSPENLPIIT